MFNRFIRWPGFRSYSNKLIPKGNLALFVDPGTQMIDNAKPNHRYPALLTGQEQADNTDFHDFTIDYPSIGESDPFYESDFSAETDGWDGWHGTVVGNVDGIAGEDNCLKFYANNDNYAHAAYRSYLIPGNGQITKITAKIFLPSSNTNVNGVKVFVGGAKLLSATNDVTTTDSWVSISVEYQNNDSDAMNLDFRPTKNGNFTFAGANDPNDDLFYVKDIKVQKVGLIAWWQFDSYYHAQEGTGKTILQDLSGNGYDLTASGGFDWQNQLTGDDPVYKNGNALEFDGVDDCAYKPASASEIDLGDHDFTFVGWAKVDNNADSDYLFGKYVDINNRWYVRKVSFDGGATVLLQMYGMAGGVNFVSVTKQINDFGGYLFYAIVGDRDNNVTVYLSNSSGVLETNSGTITSDNSVLNTTFTIGQWNGVYSHSIQSSLAYFNRALSATEVKALYGKPKNWTWNETGSITNNNFKAVLSGGAELSQDITVDDETLYKEQKISTTSNDVDYFGNTTSHTITVDDGTWSYAGVKDVTNVDAVGSNFVEDFSKGGAVYGDELLIDGGFEQWNSSTDLVNWIEKDVSTGVREITRESSIVHSGSYSVKLKATGNDGTDFRIEQICETCLDVGAVYKISVWSYFKQKTNGYAQIHVETESYAVQANKNIDVQEFGWTYHEVYFIAIDDYARFRLYLRDETDGEVYFDDFSVVKVSNGNHGLVQGGLETNQPVYPYAWEFDGVNDYIDFGSDFGNFGANPFILNVWINITDDNNVGIKAILSKSDGLSTYKGWQLYLNDAKVIFRKYQDYSSDAFRVSTSALLNGRHFISVVYNNKDDNFIYVDTELQTVTVEENTLSDENVDNTANFTIGASSYLSYYFSGKIAPVAIYPFDGQDGRASVMPSNYVDHYIKKIYNNTERYFK